MNFDPVDIKVLKGLSGCKLTLVEDVKGKYTVVKYSSSEAYNPRLRIQCFKQRSFKKHNNINAPEIYDQGQFNGLEYFRMEFIKGQTLADLVKNVDIDQVTPILQDILGMLCASITKHPNAESRSIFQKKIDSLKRQCQGMPYFNQVFAKLERFDWMNIPNTYCHGDLTAENIIISGKNIYLIDFLDSFYDTWLIDVAKLLQDFELGWSFRASEVLSVDLDLKLRYCSKFIRDFICNHESAKRYLDVIYAILLLNICRIYPYAKDEVTFQWIDDKIKYLLD